MTQIVNESYLFGSKPKIAEIKVMTSQTFLMTSSIKSFDRNFERECLTKRNIATLWEYQHHYHFEIQRHLRALGRGLPSSS